MSWSTNTLYWKDSHDCFLLSRGNGWAHKTSLTLPLLPGKWAVRFMWIMNIDFVSVRKIFLVKTAPVVLFLLFFILLYLHRCSHFSVNSYYTGVSFDQYCHHTKTVNIILFFKVIQSWLIHRLLFSVHLCSRQVNKEYIVWLTWALHEKKDVMVWFGDFCQVRTYILE